MRLLSVLKVWNVNRRIGLWRENAFGLGISGLDRRNKFNFCIQEIIIVHFLYCEAGENERMIFLGFYVTLTPCNMSPVNLTFSRSS